jgi:sugar lactone lactonase YvrE
MSPAGLRAAVALLLAFAVSACAPSLQQTDEKSAIGEQGALVWPSESAPPRIAFVQTFSRPEELGIAKGFFQRVAEVLFGATDAHLVRPMAVAVVDHVIYVADPGAKGVHRFDQRNGRYDLLYTAEGSPLPSPVALAQGPAGEVYVSDSALARIFVIKPGAKGASPLALDAKLGQPTGIAFDAATGQLFVVDTAAHRVNVFDRGGKLAMTFGRRGAGDGEFNYPTLLWRTREGQLYLTDSLNFRIQVFDERGRFIRKFGRQGDGSGDLARQKGVALDRFGHVYVVDALFNAIQIFDGEANFLLAVGSQGRARGEFWLPTGIFIGDDDRIYVADSHNQRVQVFRYIGGAG